MIKAVLPPSLAKLQTTDRNVPENVRGMVSQFTKDVKERLLPEIPSLNRSQWESNLDGGLTEILVKLGKHHEISLRGSIRGAYYMKHVLEGTNIDPEEQLRLVSGMAIQDIGKGKIDLKILDKRGKLSPEEYSLIMQHVPLGLSILQDYPFLAKQLGFAIAEHHLRWEFGKGRQSPGGSMVNICDELDAATTKDRDYYRKPKTYDKVLQEFKDGVHSGIYCFEAVNIFSQGIRGLASCYPTDFL